MNDRYSRVDREITRPERLLGAAVSVHGALIESSS